MTVSCYQRLDAGVFTVVDSGPGIPDADREKVFNRFYRIDGSANGNGLGLAIVRDIVEDHGARIILESGPEGVGTSFAVELPRPPGSRKRI